MGWLREIRFLYAHTILWKVLILGEHIQVSTYRWASIKTHCLWQALLSLQWTCLRWPFDLYSVNSACGWSFTSSCPAHFMNKDRLVCLRGWGQTVAKDLSSVGCKRSEPSLQTESHGIWTSGRSVGGEIPKSRIWNWWFRSIGQRWLVNNQLQHSYYM